MKRQIAMMMAMFMLGSMAVAEEQPAETAAVNEPETAGIKLVEENGETGAAQTDALVGGEWVNIPEMQADIYLPEGWVISEATEISFVAAEGEADAPAAEEAGTEGAQDAAPTLSLSLQDFEGDLIAYADETYGEYALESVNAGDAVVVTDAEADTMTVLFLYDEDTLASLELTPASDEELAAQLTTIAATFCINQIDAAE